MEHPCQHLYLGRDGEFHMNPQVLLLEQYYSYFYLHIIYILQTKYLLLESWIYIQKYRIQSKECYECTQPGIIGAPYSLWDQYQIYLLLHIVLKGKINICEREIQCDSF